MLIGDLGSRCHFDVVSKKSASLEPDTIYLGRVFFNNASIFEDHFFLHENYILKLLATQQVGQDVTVSKADSKFDIYGVEVVEAAFAGLVNREGI